MDSQNESPEPVRRTVEFLRGKGIWFQLSRNREARSCRDAANKRVRLGHEGIPLWDELKSFFGKFENASGHNQFFIAHCRGDRVLDLGRLQTALRARALPERLGDAEIRSLGLEYGLVNPFKPFSVDGQLIISPILQVFDQDLLKPIGIPGTVMTNAGDVTWAVEVFAHELSQAIDNSVVAEISDQDPSENPRLWGVRERRVIGIITGNSPESGISLWNSINQNIRTLLGQTCCGDISMPPVIVQSLPEMGLSMELDSREAEVWRALRQASRELCAQGVDMLTIADNTTHYFAPKIQSICAEYGAEFLSMPQATALWLKAEGVNQVAVVGVRYVSDLGEWSAYREPLAGTQVEALSSRAKDLIQDLAYQVKAEGVNEAGLNRLRDILRKEVSAQHVVLGLTELSLLLQFQGRQGKSGKVLIDPLRIYAEYVARRYLGLPETPEYYRA